MIIKKWIYTYSKEGCGVGIVLNNKNTRSTNNYIFNCNYFKQNTQQLLNNKRW